MYIHLKITHALNIKSHKTESPPSSTDKKIKYDVAPKVLFGNVVIFVKFKAILMALPI